MNAVTWGGDAMPDGVVMTPAAAALLTARGARALTDRIRRSLERAAADLVAAFHGRAHEALGYGEGAQGWQGYVDAEFGDLRLLRLPIDDRRALAAAMADDGFSVREQARGTGVSVGQAHNDRRPLRAVPDPAAADDVVVPPAVEPIDDRAVRVEPVAVLSKRDRAVVLVAEQGGRGLTALELCEVTGWTGGSATGTMTDVARQGRVIRTGVFRRGYAAYIAV